jgi:hypothetical protein
MAYIYISYIPWKLVYGIRPAYLELLRPFYISPRFSTPSSPSSISYDQILLYLIFPSHYNPSTTISHPTRYDAPAACNVTQPNTLEHVCMYASVYRVVVARVAGSGGGGVLAIMEVCLLQLIGV